MVGEDYEPAEIQKGVVLYQVSKERDVPMEDMESLHVEKKRKRQ